MIAALFKALAQMSDPAIQRVIWRTLGWSVALFAVLLAAAWWLLVSTAIFQIGWLETAVDVLGGLAAVIAAFVLFPGAALVIISFLLEPVARAVEAAHYPDLPAPRAQPVSEALWLGIRFAAVTVVLNLLFLPLYFVPLLNVFVFGTLNGYLLGREYFELVALRRLDTAEARAMWRGYRGRLFLAGLVITVLLSIPLVNWFMPVVAAAFMVHIFERLRRRKVAG
jgi:CysZ protein